MSNFDLSEPEAQALVNSIAAVAAALIVDVIRIYSAKGAIYHLTGKKLTFWQTYGVSMAVRGVASWAQHGWSKAVEIETRIKETSEAVKANKAKKDPIADFLKVMQDAAKSDV